MKTHSIILAAVMFGSGILTRHIYDKSSSSSRLVELPNGTWVHAAKVTAIYTLPLLPADEYRKEPFPDRVIVMHNSGATEIIKCESLAAAEKEADRLAELIVSKTH